MKDLNNYPGYKIDINGNVFNKTGHRLATIINHGGYEKLNIKVGKKTHNLCIHRLLALNFIPNPDNKPQVNHINGIRTDNRIENLELVTASENVIDGFKRGRKVPVGEASSSHKITEIQAIEIKQALESGVKLKVVAEKYGICIATASNIRHGKKWKHLS